LFFIVLQFGLDVINLAENKIVAILQLVGLVYGQTECRSPTNAKPFSLAVTQMDTYRNILLLLKDLLHKSENFHWEQWIERDIYEWDDLNSTSHHKSAFGGMGSINDLFVGGHGKTGAWQNNMFNFLKPMSWTFATIREIRLPKTTATNIQGTICKDCSYSEITENEIEDYISDRYLPRIISTLLPSEQYVDLINIEELANRTEVNLEREKLLNALKEFNINFSSNDNWLKNCLRCNSINTCIYRWEVSYTKGKIILTRSKNNLTIKSDKTITTWWKRLMGYS